MAGRPDVDAMLREVPAKTITEWRAYEELNGRIDRSWDQQALAMVDLRLQQLIQITLAANSDKGKTKYKVDPLPLPWENEKDIAKRKQATAVKRSGPKHEKSKKDFYASLAARNKKRGVTAKSIEESKAKAAKLGTETTKKAGDRWRLTHH